MNDEEIEIQNAEEAEALVEGFRTLFRDRLRAGLNVTPDEWETWDADESGRVLQALWIEERHKYQLEQYAYQAQCIASALRTNWVNENIMYEQLPPEKQDALLRQRAVVVARYRKAHA